MAVSVSFAIKNALSAAREDAGSSEDWFDFGKLFFHIRFFSPDYSKVKKKKKTLITDENVCFIKIKIKNKLLVATTGKSDKKHKRKVRLF